MTEKLYLVRTFRYDRLPPGPKPRQILWLAKTDRLFATVQVTRNGGETNLHSHSHLGNFYALPRSGR